LNNPYRLRESSLFLQASGGFTFSTSGTIFDRKLLVILFKNIADIVLKTQGGKGVVRELVEDVLEIDLIKILYH